MACETAPRFKYRFAVRLVSLRLRRHLAIETVLPEIRRDAFKIFLALFAITVEAPERRHLCAGAKSLGVSQPNRNPFLAQLPTNVFEILSDLLLILLQLTRLQIQFIDARRQLAVLHAQRIRVGQQSLRLSIVAR